MNKYNHKYQLQVSTTSMATYSKNPIELATSKVLATHQDDIIPILDTHGVAVLALDTIEKSSSNMIETTKFYNTANAMLKDEFKVKEPSTVVKLNPAKYKKEKQVTTHKACCINMALLFIP